MIYRTNQYPQEVYQFETEISEEGSKPIFLKALTQGSERVRPDFAAPDGPRHSHAGRLL